MNILFLTLYRIDNICNKGIYEDLLREFIKNHHNVYVVSPVERRYGKETHMQVGEGYHLLRVKTGNIQKTNLMEKGIATLLLESQYIFAIRKYLPNVKFDLVLYSTPPITLAGVVKYIKNRDGAKTYLLLKDIFPQNAVDIGMMSKTGIKGILYRYFRKKEKMLYALSDKIGCMSPANAAYVIKHNPEVAAEKVEVCPNCIDPIDTSIDADERRRLREHYDIPQDRTVLVYGGNLGKPQGIQFLIECLQNQKENDKVFFLIVGDGSEYGKLQSFVSGGTVGNVKLLKHMPRDEYDRMIAACDVGMIFLDHRFTIPNFPSRLLSYMQARLPVLAVTDANTDIGKIIVENEFGWWCEGGDLESFARQLDKMNGCDQSSLGQNAWRYLNQYYHVRKGYETIIRHLSGS